MQLRVNLVGLREFGSFQFNLYTLVSALEACRRQKESGASTVTQDCEDSNDQGLVSFQTFTLQIDAVETERLHCKKGTKYDTRIFNTCHLHVHIEERQA